MYLTRYLLLAALAVNAYLLIHQWSQVEKESPAPAVQQLESYSAAETPAAHSAEIPVRQAEDPASEIPRPADLPLDTDMELPVTDRAAPDLIEITTDVLRLQVDPNGGDLVLAQLPGFPVSLDEPDRSYVLLDRQNNEYVAQSGLIGPDGPDASGRPRYEAQRSSYSLGYEETLAVPLVYEDGSGLRVTKTYRFTRGSHAVRVEFEVENRRPAPARLNLFAQIKRDDREPSVLDAGAIGIRPYIGATTNTGSKRYEKLSFKKTAETAFRSTADQGYMAMIQHYFLTAWITEGPGPYVFSGRKLQDRNVYLYGFTGPALNLAPGSAGRVSASFYVGPKDQYVLRELSEGLELTVDYGFLWMVAQPLFYTLTFMHGLVNNWGLAIILLTALVKGFFYYPSAVSYRSMAKMRSLQPELQRLRAQHGNDRQKFSQEMMALYTKHGANPLAGCLPMLLQLPVFIALYWVLLESVELRQAPLDGWWIRDLSTLDPWFILPILMGISMYATMSMQPEPPDPMQARVMKMMPIMFTFFFLWFPSGLVLYWLCNNVLSLLQQWWIYRQIGIRPGGRAPVK